MGGPALSTCLRGCIGAALLLPLGLFMLSIPGLGVWPFACLMGGPLLVLLVVLDWKARVYTLTNKRVICRSGMIRPKVCEVSTKDILNVKLTQGIYDLVFGVGTVSISSAGPSRTKVRFAGISSPTAVMELVRKEKEDAEVAERQAEDASDQGGKAPGHRGFFVALGSTAALYGLYYASALWSTGYVFLAFLVLSLAECVGLWMALRGLTHEALLDRILSIIATAILVLALPVSGCCAAFWALKLLWQISGGHGWTPFM